MPRSRLVVAFNSLMDIERMPEAVQEAARVLGQGGRMCISVTHPMADAGRFLSREQDAPFVISGTYLAKRDFEEHVERDGLEMTFSGWAYPIEAYFASLEDAGLLVESLREPTAPEDDALKDEAERRWSRIPNFLHLRASEKDERTPDLGAQTPRPARCRPSALMLLRLAGAVHPPRLDSADSC